MIVPRPDVALAHRLFRQLHDDSADGDGVTRDAYGPGEQRAHDLIAAEGARLGLEQHVDPAGNLLLTLAGRDRGAKRVLIGSHLDSVVRGGDYDGPVGVLAGLACLAGMVAAEFRPERDIGLIVTRAEEAGAWFAVSFPGSRAALGTLEKEALSVPRRDTGRTLAQHMRDAGFMPERIEAGAGWLGADTIAAFLEVHIEQGPVLDGLDVPVGIVTGIPGGRRHRAIRIIGESNHSGATPRAYRRDAAMAAAELAFRLDQEWARMLAEGHELVCTVCVLTTGADAAFTLIAGSARMELDMRSVSRDSLDLLHDALERLAAEISVRRRVTIELGPETGSQACAMAAVIQDGLARAAASLGHATHRMASGGGHDAAAFAQAGVPAGMLFVRNQNGSHSPREAMHMADFDVAAEMVMHWLLADAAAADAGL